MIDAVLRAAQRGWLRLPKWAKPVVVIAGIGIVMWGQGAFMQHRHDARLVSIYCGGHPHCADHVTADYVREGRTLWAREAVRTQDAEDDAYEEACPGGRC